MSRKNDIKNANIMIEREMKIKKQKSFTDEQKVSVLRKLTPWPEEKIQSIIEEMSND